MKTVAAVAPVAKRRGPKCESPTKRTDYPCRNPAGFRTDHPGAGRCYLHGGRSLVKHGKYRTIYDSTLGEAIERFEQDPDALSLFRELATLRALTERFIVRYEEFREQLDAWYEDWTLANPKGQPPRPPRLLDLYDARVLLDDVGKMVARIEKIRAQNAISQPEMIRLMTEMARVVDHVVSRDVEAGQAEAIKEEVRERWLQIRL